LAVHEITLAFLLGTVTAPALACDCVNLVPSSPRFESDLDSIVRFYPIAGEGLVEPDGPYAWRFRPTREYRGPRQASYRIELGSDCSIAPDEMKALIGKPVFLLLNGGPDRYEAGRCVNLLAADVTAAIRDRYLGSCQPR
jgi:hypothetical protein